MSTATKARNQKQKTDLETPKEPVLDSFELFYEALPQEKQTKTALKRASKSK